MTISVFELFSVGIGPSSSHTVGPMRAAARFVTELASRASLTRVSQLRVELFGSLAATGAGHGTLSAILLGLEGFCPDTLEPDYAHQRLAELRASGTVHLGGCADIALRESDFHLHPAIVKPRHSNAMTLTAYGSDSRVLHSETYYSVGGGFILTDAACEEEHRTGTAPAPWSFHSAADLLALADMHGIDISEVMRRFELTTRSLDDIQHRLLHLRDVMVACAERGISQKGYLPGNLGIPRRAHGWYSRLAAEDRDRNPAFAEDWVNLIALAVNEENASGGRIVTAPTNGAAGIVPAVLHYATHYTRAGETDPDDTAIRFLLTAGAIGSLYKERASISGAEVGCQGEVGSAASMAAGGLAEILGGTPQQVENAAEIAMEHSLGLTCDPIGGLVQIPCIERNAISAGKAINAARMALRGNGTHRVSLDQVIETMRTTGMDMSSKYKETATGGLAINVPVSVVEC
ncbi:L-serine ammonia-lyase [Mycolicibacterium agri]|uniref:L-serine dehydratase n=1 Tax=Mycolicibacterium agri TaxID=36811 RepID=A0A2A7MQH8_MYCAG|nr:L-serine ammonia-lyase [Mycolicibacterium agri]PEG33819.1 L-serine ammonia-lyase [Mycolicibacterium agri]GFG52441.1 L-serine ammonia-lyase [Mycolicibacterium agri]